MNLQTMIYAAPLLLSTSFVWAQLPSANPFAGDPPPLVEGLQAPANSPAAAGSSSVRPPLYSSPANTRPSLNPAAPFAYEPPRNVPGQQEFEAPGANPSFSRDYADDAHAGHDHAGHDHAGHDHAGHDHAGHDHGPSPGAKGFAGGDYGAAPEPFGYYGDPASGYGQQFASPGYGRQYAGGQGSCGQGVCGQGVCGQGVCGQGVCGRGNGGAAYAEAGYGGTSCPLGWRSERAGGGCPFDRAGGGCPGVGRSFSHGVHVEANYPPYPEYGANQETNYLDHAHGMRYQVGRYHSNYDDADDVRHDGYYHDGR
ncbi:urease accessory protein UreE [Lignipirellula cremea]|uniref:Uncharacterized protein n=1 Tax=Lignipirellula cremea TaxID=2528010 RepID=A0A518E3M4_9BACT|nr:hypothetical protein [Lignipirellula cremea]QDU98689.1 hypothetical protein Pla8534_65620 [Lignipirellula cremea]